MHFGRPFGMFDTFPFQLKFLFDSFEIKHNPKPSIHMYMEMDTTNLQVWGHANKKY